uniref:Zinc/manganese transport system substrate-binding protein n=1 Tax=Candidatus Kentrum sp. FW TaxID=2126338 RepID=A0A450T1C5_9GAMM|nr:MAG: zinc/manganese transport system substrate-binding protein [Candidatus Kentron sp. FW]
MFNQWIKIVTLVIVSILSIINPAHADVRVFACEPEWSALVRSLGGKHVTIYTATTNRQDPHHIQARPSLIAKARRADLLICSGAELEIGWLPLLLRKSGNPKIQPGQPGHFMATDYVTLLEKPTVLDRSEGDIHAAGNPHIQLDPMRMLQVAENLSRTLAKIDPAHLADYREKLASFTGKWQDSLSRWRERAQPIKGKSIVVHHNNWVYLRKWLGLDQAATLEPKPGIPPTSSHLSQLLSGLQQTAVHKIIYASYQDDRAANWLSEKTGIPTIALDISPATDETLIQWFERLIDQLLKVPT